MQRARSRLRTAFAAPVFDIDEVNRATADIRVLLKEHPNEKVRLRQGGTRWGRETRMPLARMRQACETRDVGLHEALVQTAVSIEE